MVCVMKCGGGPTQPTNLPPPQNATVTTFVNAGVGGEGGREEGKRRESGGHVGEKTHSHFGREHKERHLRAALDALADGLCWAEITELARSGVSRGCGRRPACSKAVWVPHSSDVS